MRTRGRLARGEAVVLPGLVALLALLAGPARVPAAPPPAGAPPSGTAARGPWIEAAMDSAHITVGSPAHVTVRVHVPAGVEVSAPAIPGDLGEVVVQDVTPGAESVGSEGERVQESIITMTAFATGAFAVPPVAAVATRAGAAPDTLRSEPLRLVVRSVLTSGADSAKLHDIKDLARLPGSTFPLRAVLLGLLAAAAAAALFIWLRRRLGRRARRAPAPVPAAPPEPPAIVARRALRELRARGLHLRNLMDEFYTELTAIMRKYLGDRFQFAAIDMTTTEIMTELEIRRVRGVLPGEVTALAAPFLEEADLVKFARGRPAVDAAEAAFESAERLIAITGPLAAPAAETSAAMAGAAAEAGS